MSATPRARALLAVLLPTLLALGLRVGGLAGQPLLADDHAVGATARSFAEHGWPEPTMWNHPRLRDLLVNASLDLLGEGPWGLKAWSVATGTLSVAALGLLLLALTGSALAAAVGGLLLATDGLHLDFSRQGINDVYLALFPVAAVLALLRYRASRRPGWLLAGGLALGLGLASKWSAAFPVGVAAAVLLADAWRLPGGARGRAAELAFLVAGLGLLPLGLYLLTFLPWFGHGHDLGEWLLLQRRMAYETATHTGYEGTKLPGFPGEIVSAWRWFAAPAWYVDFVSPEPGSGAMPFRFIAGVGNPLAWLATLPAAAFAAWRWRRAGDAAAGWLLALFLAAWLPFALVPRPVWTNSALGVLPFALALVGWAAARFHAWRPWPVRAWLAAGLLLAALLVPAALGLDAGTPGGVLRALVSDAALDPGNHR